MTAYNKAGSSLTSRGGSCSKVDEIHRDGDESYIPANRHRVAGSD